MANEGLVERCLELVPDCFSLVVLAAYRSQELAAGVKPLVSAGVNKGSVISLREIASGILDLTELKNRRIRGFQQFAFLSEGGV